MTDEIGSPLLEESSKSSDTHTHERRRSSIIQSVDKKIQAYERQPVPHDRLKGWLSFLGLFTSRHTAGTEFAIGPLFVANGATAIDVIVGLAIGNLLATLSWRYVVAPIAVEKRLTAYYAMERVVGRRLVLVYDAVSCVLLAGLAGAMFTVSATAFAAIFNVDAPELSDMYPTNASFVVIVIICGLVTTIVAAIGFSVVTLFGDLMTPVLIAGIIYLCVESLRMLGIGESCNLWCILSEKVYTGNVVDGRSKFGMAQCIFFAWFCDLQVHLGQNDLSLLRFAKTANVGWTSAGGMYVGHYFAWIVAGMMYAVQLQEYPDMKSSVAPGYIAQLVGGDFGLAIIIIAGWSTANPVIYSAGLGLQHIFPSMHAWMSTIIVGLLATAAACFPALTNGIMEFLTLAGILLCPMGVFLFADHFVFPRVGLSSELSYNLTNDDEAKCTYNNWPAIWTWPMVEVLSLPVALLTPVSLYFTPVITLVFSFVSYLGLTKLWVSKGWIVYDKIGARSLLTSIMEEEEVEEGKT